MPGTVHEGHVLEMGTLVSSSRTLRDESQRLLQASRSIVAESTARLLSSHELLVSLGKARRFCGGSDPDPAGEVGGVCAHCSKGFEASDRIVDTGPPKQLFHRTCYREREGPVSATITTRRLAYMRSRAARGQGGAGVRRPDESSAALIGAILAALPGEAAILDTAGTILQVNEAWASAARSAPADSRQALSVGANYLDACRRAIAMPADAAPKVHASLESVLRGERAEFALEYRSSQRGEDRWLEIHVRRLAPPDGGAVVIRVDVTARRQAEGAARRYLSQLAHLDRVASMGQLASSLAHELSQPLAAILCNAQAASRLLGAAHPDLADLRACLADIISDDQRAAEVIWRMRRLLKKTDVVRLPLVLNDLVTNTIALVANDALLHGVSVKFAPAAALPNVYGDLVQIQQVILNLLANAITAAAGPSRMHAVTVWTAAAAAPYVETGVHDSGVGIPDGDLDRLFEPFFTTKDDGLGMGLAISRMIVEAHGGRLLVENDPAGGATFRLLLRTDQPLTT